MSIKMKKLILPDQNGNEQEFEVVDELMRNTFVTPEMFGAVGDGVTDDTAAFQLCIDSGAKNIYAYKEYSVSQITIGGKDRELIFNRIKGTIVIGGSTVNEGVFIKGNRIDAPSNGYAIKLISTASSNYIEHSVVEVKKINCADNSGISCIYIESSGSGAFVNDNRFSIQWSAGFTNGLSINCTNGEITENQFVDCDFALNTIAFDITQTDGTVRNVYITDCRFGESYGTNKKAIKTTGKVYGLNIINANINQPNLDFSNTTYGLIIGKVITAESYLLTRPINHFFIREGIIVPQNPTTLFKNLRGTDTNLPTDANGIVRFINFNFNDDLYIPEIYKRIPWSFFINIGYLTHINFWDEKTIDLSTGYTQWKWYEFQYIPTGNQIVVSPTGLKTIMF